MLEILTPLVKLHRVSRSVDPSTFTAVPGIWGVLLPDGSLRNVVDDEVPSVLNKLVVNSASNNKYESNDVEVGRVTTIEDVGTRVLVDGAGAVDIAGMDQGDPLAVGTKVGGTAVMLFSVNKNPTGEASGDYEVVAMVEEIDATSGTLVFRTVSPVLFPVT